jgi:hypothetical protein
VATKRKPAEPAGSPSSNPATEAPKFRLPATLAGCADRLYELRTQRLALQKQVDALASEEAFLRDYLIENVPKSEATGIAGKLCRVTVVTKEVPQVADWDAFYAAIKKGKGTEGFALLGRSISKAAIEERWAAGKQVPGVEPFQVVTLSVNKV